MENKVFSHKKWESLVSSEREEKMSVNKFFDISSPSSDEVWGDIGCGPGYFTLPLAQKVKKVYAVDISEEMLNICKSRSNKFNLPNIEYVKTEEKILPIKSEIFDELLLVNVYHEFPDRNKIGKELNRILKSRGILYIIDWHYKIMDFGPPLEHRISEKRLIEDMELAGFNFVKDYSIYEFNYVLEFKKDK